ncbi:MAG: permease [Candidatus Omnitrophica bacterium]|nr:permease [Candidatus Omnitrophota bacterium]MBU0878947.1 permease [Candidatus Omnitrophota bacterium]MBU0896726.1 permease [Candidatus Omnitrophota bacterium]MBU1133955.1 permease [Candidatus Omnitrophota bacterium]MBU1809820.1 permease [Candidatus Omnitrophota bacterium]
MLQLIIDWLVYSVFGLSSGSRLGEVINFFLYDSIKILLLLFFMIAVIGFIRTYISQNTIKGWISKKKVLGNIFASLFGSITPFCSCSSIPIFLSFLEVGIPLGATFSFLITSPLINEYLVIIMLGFFGWKITLLYVLSGITIGVISGVILGKMRLERYLVKDLVSEDAQLAKEKVYTGIRERIIFGIDEAKSITKKLWMWVLLGVGIGSFIHNYIPQETIRGIISKTGPFSVPLATILGVPMYGSCAAIVPIAVILFRKGVPLGTALAFMMATAALSFPEAVILRRAMKLQLIAIFFGVTTLAIIITGYLFNMFQLMM